MSSTAPLLPSLSSIFYGADPSLPHGGGCSGTWGESPFFSNALATLLTKKDRGLSVNFELKKRYENQIKTEKLFSKLLDFIRNSIDKVKEDFNKLFNFFSFGLCGFNLVDSYIAKLSNNMSPVGNRFSYNAFLVSLLNSVIEIIFFRPNPYVFKDILKDNSPMHYSHRRFFGSKKLFDELLYFIWKRRVNKNFRLWKDGEFISFKDFLCSNIHKRTINISKVDSVNGFFTDCKKEPIARKTSDSYSNSFRFISFLIRNCYGFMLSGGKAERTNSFNKKQFNTFPGGCYV